MFPTGPTSAPMGLSARGSSLRILPRGYLARGRLAFSFQSLAATLDGTVGSHCCEDGSSPPATVRESFRVSLSTMWRGGMSAHVRVDVSPGLRPGSVPPLAPEQQTDHAGARADHGQRRGGPEREHPFEPTLHAGELLHQFDPELRQPLLELGVELGLTPVPLRVALRQPPLPLRLGFRAPLPARRAAPGRTQ